MIVRIMNYGQYRVPDDAVPPMNELDDQIEAAVENNDQRRFQACLTELVAFVQDRGTLLSPGEFVSSEAVVPANGATLEEIRSLLTAEGLIPDRAPSRTSPS